MRVISGLLIIFSLLGCSNRAIYENAQINQRERCLKVLPAEYDECMERANKPFDEYEKERKEVLNKHS